MTRSLKAQHRVTREGCSLSAYRARDKAHFCLHKSWGEWVSVTVVGVAMLHPVKHKRALRAADTAALLGGLGAQFDDRQQ